MAWTAWAIGLRPEHWLITIAYTGLFWSGPRLAYFMAKATPFLLVGITYDNLGWLTVMHADVHVADVFELERALFGVGEGPLRETLPRWFQTHTHAILDALCGIAYILYFPAVLVFAVVLFFRDQARMTTFAWAFFVLNILGMVTWVVFPVAPPWYVDAHGLGPAILDAAPSAAGAARFDALFGISYFENFYARNTYIFGAMPSLHTGYPALVFVAALGLGRGYALGTALFTALVGFSAIYLNHHYLLDVLAGIIYAVVAYGVTRKFQKRLN